MVARRSFVSSWLGAALAAMIVTGALVESGPAVAAESRLVPVPVAGAPDEGIRLDDATPAYARSCAQQSRRCDDVVVFAATRSLRESGIQPVVAVALSPATLAVDAVSFPFALALEYLANWQ
ncbi:MAG: hypothetical protein ABI080_15040 [Candidatus Binatia bacterium]